MGFDKQELIKGYQRTIEQNEDNRVFEAVRCTQETD